MTPFQSRRIAELRLKGLGYRTIATEVGLTRDTVRNYCKSHTLGGYAPEVVKNAAGHCRNCGQQIEQPATGRKRLYCSDECRRAWWAANQAYINRSPEAFYNLTCRYCGKSFTSYGNRHQKYCSHNCYIHDRFWKKEEGRI